MLDGLAKIDALMDRVRLLGQEALAITDHGNLYGAIDFYSAGHRHGVKPILGLEAYVAGGSRADRDAHARSNYFHLTLLAQNLTGWRNLITLATKAHLEGFYYRPRIDRELLAAHSEGLIVLSGCPSGELHRALLVHDDDAARKVIGWHREVFGDRYYLELQNHYDPKFMPAIAQIAALGKEFKILMAATHDAHYCNPEDALTHEVLLCIGTNSTMDQTDRFKLDGDDFYLASEREMHDRFADFPDAVTNTSAVADRCDVNLEFGRLQLPDPDLPSGVSAIDHLTDIAFKGLEQRYGAPTPIHIERLKYELDVVRQTGFAEYFLIVRDFAQFAQQQGIAMGVRGSAAASIILYCLEITDIDPLAFDLVFERFLNLERHEMPDIDMDFADNRRDEVIHYVADKYGHDRVAQIITFGTLGAKAAIRDTGRALGMSFAETDRVARLIPAQLNITLGSALEQNSELRSVYESEPPVRRLIDQASKLEGVARHAGTHAAAVVISREPLINNVPLQRPVRGDDESTPMTQWAMNQCAEIGLLKMDFLGLTNLTILDAARTLIAETTADEVDDLAIPDGDEETFALLSKGETFGVFQLESPGMRRYVQDLRPTKLAELAAMVALYRPGPMEHIPRYIRGKHGEEAITYPHDDLAQVLDETYGVIVYQDQVLQIAQKFAGYTLGQADVMRKAMGKKIAEVMQAERGGFVEGAARLGYSATDANAVFDLIEPFAGYAFNKAHAVCYGSIAYRTAYLKAHYPVQYMTAVLRAASESTDRVGLAAAECARMGIPLLPPDINHSGETFQVEPVAGGAAEAPRMGIRFGLTNVKNVGAGAVAALIAERREHGAFRALEDLCSRADTRALNKRMLESLIKAGALDDLTERGLALAGIDRIMRLAQREQELKSSGQTTMFDLFGQEVDTPRPELALPEIKGADVTRAERLQWEKELLGAYVSEHPFQRAAADLDRYVTARAAEIGPDLERKSVMIAGAVTLVRPLITREGDAFCAVEIEDLSGSVEVTVWPDLYTSTRSLWNDGTILLVQASVRSRGERLTVAVERATPYIETADGSGSLREDPSQWAGKPRPDRWTPSANASPAPAALRPIAVANNDSAPPSHQVRERPPAPPPADRGNGGNGSKGSAPALQIRLHGSGDEAADQERLRAVIQIVKATPGPHRTLLTVDDVGERVTLALQDCTASWAMLDEINRTLREHGEARIEALPASLSRAAVGG